MDHKEESRHESAVSKVSCDQGMCETRCSWSRVKISPKASRTDYALVLLDLTIHLCQSTCELGGGLEKGYDRNYYNV